MKEILQIHSLEKKYGNKKILSDVNLSLKKGEIVGLIGKNGSGKTTLMKAILGFTSINSGRIEFLASETYQSEPDKMQKIAFLLDCKLFEYLNGFDNLFIIQKYSNLKTSPKILEEKIKNMLDFFDLDNNSKPVRSYSFGMKQRLGLAIALMSEPKLLILDEPFVGLDPRGVQLFINYIKKLKEEKGITILISSHQLHEVEQLCDYYLFIKNHRLTQIIGTRENEMVISIKERIPDIQNLFPKGVKIKDKTITFEKKVSLLNQVFSTIIKENLTILDIEIGDKLY